MTIGRKGFTLIELSISAIIVALMAFVIIFVYRSNLISWKWGTKHIDFNQKIQLTSKQIFSDIKKINPIVFKDSADNFWFQGERIGDLFPNLVQIIDRDKNPDNGGEELVFYHTSFLGLEEENFIRIFLEKDELVRESTDRNGVKKRKVVAEKISNLHFLANPRDIFEVVTKMTIEDDQTSGLKEELNFAVHLDTDLVCVKFIRPES